MSRWPNVSAEDRFWAKVEKTEKCWLWTGGIQSAGYGMFWLTNRKVLAHRFSYELAHGSIPVGHYIDHACHNPRCVNPSHLRVATHKQNQENRKGAQANSQSGIRGVSWVPSRNKWIAQIGHHGRHYNLGYFANIEDAAAACERKRKELFTHNPLAVA